MKKRNSYHKQSDNWCKLKNMNKNRRHRIHKEKKRKRRKAFPLHEFNCSRKKPTRKNIELLSNIEDKQDFYSRRN
jgi:hypothetical protein